MSQPFEFTLQFGAGSVDSQRGVLTGVCVAEVGIATGHYAFADAHNVILGVGGFEDLPNFKGATKRLQLAMDEKSLKTVVEAGKKSKRFKTREDHNDDMAARAGFSENFRMVEGKVVCDVTIFDSYANRGVFLETAEATPELVGLSGDFKFVAEVIGDKAMMRVTRIDAVDLVDQGALTHAGLFRVKTQVDTPPTENLSIMAKSAPEKPDFKAFKSMCEQVAAYRAANAEDGATIDECMAVFQPIEPVKVPTPSGAPAPVTGKPDNTDASVKDTEANLAALKDGLSKELSASFATLLTEALDKNNKAQQVEFQKQMSALGLKPAATKVPTAEEVAAAEAQAKDTAAKLAAKDAPQDFLSLRAARAKEKNVTLSEASRQIIEEQPAVYEASLKARGIIR